MADYTTLVTGPSGTGKELVARAVGLSRYIPFDAQRRRFTEDFVGSFFPLNLSALSPTLIESELFGHRRGAFTGAVEDRLGWLEICPPQGTVFLDEIGELEPMIQVKLLRVLQERSFSRLGETDERQFHGKLIAATNRDLAEQMECLKFREDLYYRLCSDIIVTPGLHERLADDPSELRELVVHIARRLVGDEAEAVAEEVLVAIEAQLGRDYPWPGNIRELKNCIERMMALADGNLLQFLDLPTTVAYHMRARAGMASAAVVHGGGFGRPNMVSRPEMSPIAPMGFSGAPLMMEGGILPLYEVERRAIQHALVHTKGDRTEAASLLGIGRTTLYRKLKEYQMN
jgi:DNA-binding NtrC family response regulator